MASLSVRTRIHIATAGEGVTAFQCSCGRRYENREARQLFKLARSHARQGHTASVFEEAVKQTIIRPFVASESVDGGA